MEATLKLTVQTATLRNEEEEEVLALTSSTSMTKNKHGWIIVEPRTLRANATAIKAAGIDWKTSRGMQMVGEWTALAAKEVSVGEIEGGARIESVCVCQRSAG